MILLDVYLIEYAFSFESPKYKKVLQQVDENQFVVLRRDKLHAAQDDNKKLPHKTTTKTRKKIKNPIFFCGKTTLLKKKMVQGDVK